MTTIDRTESPQSEFDGLLAGWESRPDAPESWAATVERMARAMWENDGGDVRWIAVASDSYLRARYVRLATAALRVVTEPVDGA